MPPFSPVALTKQKRPPDDDSQTESLEDRRLLAITVNTLVDELDGSIADGDVSLRDAIAAAPAGETINFNVTGTIDLSLGHLSINKNLTINGPGADQLTIDALGNSRVLSVSGNSTASIRGLTVTGGNALQGGGIRVSPGTTTTLTDMVIRGNTATSTFDAGGGIWNQGTLTLDSSTVSDNSAVGDGRGLWNGSNGPEPATITNSTISGNMASRVGGLFFYWTGSEVKYSTVSNNHATEGAGIFSREFINTQIRSSLVAGNAGGEDLVGAGAANNSFHSFGHNLIGGGNGSGAFDLASDQVIGAAGDPRLGPLADNGGPTPTHALLFGSPAMEGGNPSVSNPPSLDQRGSDRIVGTIDIGAFERGLSDPLTPMVDTLIDEDDGDFSPGDLSLREAIGVAQADSSIDTIEFASGLGGTIQLQLGVLDISDERRD